MAKATPIDKLNTTITKILQEYSGEISTDLAEATRKVAQAGVTALRQQSRANFKGTGEYAKGWKKLYEEKRLTSYAILYNDHYSLPHLLEFGHAKRGGGRTQGRPHIEPVEEQLIQQFQREVEGML